MKPARLVRWKPWLPVLWLLPACVLVFREWLVAENIASWLSMVSFCS